jgi:hypothetical protein
LHVQVTVGEPIVVSPERERGAEDPVVAGIELQLKQMLGINS